MTDRFSRELLAVAETIPVIVWGAAREGRTDYFNSAWFDYTGLTPEQSYPGGWDAVMHPEDRPRVSAAWREAVRRGDRHDVEFRLRGRDGVYRWFLSRGQPTREPDGSSGRWLGTCTDIETQKRAAESLAIAKERAEFLAEADTIIERSFATPRAMAELARLAASRFATLCFYDAIGEDGSLVRLAAEHRDPELHQHWQSTPPGEPPWRIARLPYVVFEAGVGRLTSTVTEEWVAEAAFDAAHSDWIRSLGMNSALHVPIATRGRSFGVMTFGRMPPLRPFTEDDLATAQELGRRAAAMLENVRLYALARDNERRAAAIADAVPQIFWTARADGWIDWFNRGWYEYTGQSPLDAEGWGWQAMHHPRELPDVFGHWTRAIAAAEPFEMSYRLRGTDGAYRWFLTRVVPQQDEEGEIVRWYGSTTNVDAERRATLQLAFFAELGERLTAQASLEAALEAVVEALVPNFAEWSIVELIEDDVPYVATAEHMDARLRDELRALVGRQGGAHLPSAAIADALRLGRPAIAYGDARSREPGALAYTTAACVPLLFDGRTRGVLTLAIADDAATYGEDDLPFLAEIGRRIAPALAQAEIYERERRIAETFQSAVLPRRLPEIAGLRFDALYEPGRAEALVGGDWYDAFRIADGRIVITIGDVVGSGLAAATAMAEVRQSIRGAAAINPDPAILLDAADRVIAENGEDRYATAWVGLVDPIDFSLRYASAGHPSPFVREPDGSIRTLDGDGLPLGLSETLGQRRTAQLTTIAPGSVVALFTDGLIESERDALRGEAMTAGALAAMAPHLGSSARELRNLVLGTRAAHDDIAILLVEFERRLRDLAGEVPVWQWSFEAHDGATAAQVRDAVAERLRRRGLGSDAVLVAELIFSELLGNVVRYAPGAVDVLLDASAHVPVLHVIDGGAGFEHNSRLPVDAYEESGRGLFIVAQLARDFTIARATGGGSHARVVLETRATPAPLTLPNDEGLALLR